MQYELCCSHMFGGFNIFKRVSFIHFLIQLHLPQNSNWLGYGAGQYINIISILWFETRYPLRFGYHYILIWHKCCVFLVLKAALQFIFWTYQTVLAVLIFAFIHLVIISPLLINIYQKSLSISTQYSVDECENSLLVSNSAHTSFCTVKLKHSTVGTRKLHFWVEGDFKCTLYCNTKWPMCN